MRSRSWFAVLSVCAIGALGVAGCGGDDEEEDETPTAQKPAPAKTTGGGGGGETRLDLAADPGGALKFDKKALSAKAGKVEFYMDNQSSVPHNVAVEGNGVDEKSKVVSKGETELSVDLKAGKYTFYCSVPGHKQGGMSGTLTVK